MMQNLALRDEAKIFSLGLIPLEETIALMHELIYRRAHERIGNCILFAQHPPVYTAGRGIQLSVRQRIPSMEESLGSLKNRLPYEVVEVERGGGVTFHDPGQIMGYPIIKLDAHRGFGINQYLRALEEYLSQTLREIFPHLSFSTSPETTGVWLEHKKVVSIGIAVRRWITFHGFAVHVNTDLSAFEKIRPCGLAPSRIGNLPLGECPPQTAIEKILRALEKNFPLYF